MAKAYVLYAPDCDVFYYELAPNRLFCKSCGSYIGEEPYYPSKISLKQKKYDFCFTYDGRLLLSEQAKQFLQDQMLDGVSFRRIDVDPPIFVPIVSEVVHFDAGKRGTRFENRCDLCGSYESVVGATPAFLLDLDLVQEGNIYVTDLEFGSGREKAPVYIVGERLAIGLKKKFNEIDLEAVKD